MERSLNTLAATAAAMVVMSGTVLAQSPVNVPRDLEPNAGKWKTWIIPSGSAYRVPAPPGAAETRAELQMMNAMAGAGG